MIFRRGKWDLPKGKLDEGESIEACAVREVQEETGLKQVRIESFAGITCHEYFDTYIGEEVNKESHWYRMSAKSTENLLPQTEEDIESIAWVSGKTLEDCLQNSYPNVVDIIRRAGW